MRTEPRMIEMYEKGLSFDHCRWEGEPGRSVLIELLDEEVQAITHGELQRLELPTQHELFDDRVSHLTLELAHEALNGLPNGRLYAQGLSVALLGVLAGAYATSGARVAASGRLGSAQVQRLKAFIDEQLGSDLSLVRLADEAGLSAFHFARMFKATFGMTPHRYIQERRLHAAVRALRGEPRRAIADIALACGFANQSHMTSLMRERLGVTPRALRDEGA
jgi:AraC family transcriptional regulator